MALKNDGGCREAASAAIKLALTDSRQLEKEMIEENRKNGILCAAVDYGGEFVSSINKIIERAVVSSVREGVIKDVNREEGAIIGAARDAVNQISQKAMGLNVGGKIGIARYNDNICVSIFFAIGILHLNEIAVGVGHRLI